MALADNDDQFDDILDILDDVSLNSFTANPTGIGPFGASVLSWSVTGPAGFHVRLNNQVVTKTGTRVVNPTSTSTFRLSAHAGQASKPLGTVQVTVDRSSCITYDLANPRSAMEAPIRARINSSGDLSFRGSSGLAVTFSPGRIHLKLLLEKEVNNFPNTDVDINASFGLAVVDGALIPTGQQISIDISFPWYAWLVPGAALALPIAIDMAKESAAKDMREAIEGLAQLLSFLGLPPKGLRMNTVRIDNGNNGAGVIEFTACSQDLLVRFADISGSVIIQ
jgi:hypothetical protein